MPQPRFNHVFFGLLVLSAASAFLIPPRFTDPLRARVQGLFAPISGTTRAAAAWTQRRFGAPPTFPAVWGTPADVAAENRELKITVAHLLEQLQQCRQLLADRQLIGPVLQWCTQVQVTGQDPGKRQGLTVQAPDAVLEKDMAVLYYSREAGESGIAGRIERSSGVQAYVCLVSDKSFRLLGRFRRYGKDAGGKPVLLTLPGVQPLLEGDGKGGMVAHLKSNELEAAGVKIGDWAVLDDPCWPLLAGYKIGQVVAITPGREVSLVMEVKVAPLVDLSTLSQAMVLTGRQNAVAGGQIGGGG